MGNPKENNHMPVEQNSSGSRVSQASVNIDNRINLLFLRFSSIYLHKWQSMFREKHYLDYTKSQWQDALVAYSDEAIEQAFITCRQTKKWPPSLAEFAELCHLVSLSKRVSTYSPPEITINTLVASENLKMISKLLSGK